MIGVAGRSVGCMDCGGRLAARTRTLAGFREDGDPEEGRAFRPVASLQAVSRLVGSAAAVVPGSADKGDVVAAAAGRAGCESGGAADTARGKRGPVRRSRRSRHGRRARLGHRGRPGRSRRSRRLRCGHSHRRDPGRRAPSRAYAGCGSGSTAGDAAEPAAAAMLVTVVDCAPHADGFLRGSSWKGGPLQGAPRRDHLCWEHQQQQRRRERAPTAQLQVAYPCFRSGTGPKAAPWRWIQQQHPSLLRAEDGMNGHPSQDAVAGAAA